MDFGLFVTFAVSSVVFLLTPGPITLFVVGQGKYGVAHLFRAVLGTNLGSVVLIFVALMIFAGVLNVHAYLWVFLSVFGAVFLLFLAFKMLSSSYENVQELEVSRPKSVVLKGFLLGISNPKDVFFFLAFFPQFFEVMPSPLTSAGVLTGTWLILDYTILMSLALGAYHVLPARAFYVIEKISGLVFLGLSSWMLYSAYDLVF